MDTTGDDGLGMPEFAGRIDISSGALVVGGLVVEDVGGHEGQSAAVYVRRCRRRNEPTAYIAEIRIVVSPEGPGASPRVVRRISSRSTF